jgi:putative endonuclease
VIERVRRWFGSPAPDDAAPTGERGRAAEALALKHLRRHGARLVKRNWRCKLGEVDLIVLDGDALVFVEVKGRASDDHGLPSEAVSRAKRRRLERLAEAFCAKRRGADRPIRFDVVEVTWTKPPAIDWRRDAWLAGE